jgi:3D (Asp-Asp-Asp) domain-containing protein
MIMNIFRYSTTLAPRQRWTLAVLAMMLFITSQPVNAQTIAGSIETAVESQADGITVEPSQYQTLPTAEDRPVVATRIVSMTAYNSEPGQTDDTPFITANNTRVRDGIVAANFLPFNTKVRIPELFGDRVFVVTDRMNKRYTNRMDIWMEKKSDALKFGVKHAVKIEILGK